MKHTVDSYLAELEARLSPLPEEKRNEIIREYRSHLEAATGEGVSERASLAALKSPTRLSDSILRTHGVFALAEKWQVRWLGFYCLVVTGLIWYALKVTVGPVRLQAVPLYFFASTLWGFGCLPYYVACVQSRRFLWKPFLLASVFITAILWGNFAYRSRVIYRGIEGSFVASELTRADSKVLADFSGAVLKFVSYGSGSGMGHFSWYYETIKPTLNSGAHLVIDQATTGGYLVPDSSPDREQPVKFSFTNNATQASRAWDENKDRLKQFAWNAGVIAKHKAAKEWPVPLFHVKYIPSMLRYASYIVLPLCFFGVLSSAHRPLVRRRRGVA